MKTLQSQRRRKTYQQAAVVTSAVLVLTFVASSLISGWFPGPSAIPEIACKRVQQLAPQYVSSQLDADVTKQIDQHLKECNTCRDHIHAAYPQFPLPGRSANAREGISPSCTVAIAGNLLHQ